MKILSRNNYDKVVELYGMSLLVGDTKNESFNKKLEQYLFSKLG